MRAGKVSIAAPSSKAQALLQAAGSEPSSFVPFPLSKIGSLLLASLGGTQKKKIGTPVLASETPVSRRNAFACRNVRHHPAVSMPAGECRSVEQKTETFV